MFIFCRSTSDIFDNIESSGVIECIDIATRVDYLSKRCAFHLLLSSLKMKKIAHVSVTKKSSKINKIQEYERKYKTSRVK